MFHQTSAEIREELVDFGNYLKLVAKDAINEWTVTTNMISHISMHIDIRHNIVTENNALIQSRLKF